MKALSGCRGEEGVQITSPTLFTFVRKMDTHKCGGVNTGGG